MVISDTRISEHGVARPRTEGRIKTVLLDPSVAVSFAGSPELADRALANFPRFGDARFAETVDYFAKASRGGGVDYLLSFAVSKRFVRLRDGESKAVSSAWIGEQASFSRFQECLHSRNNDGRNVLMSLPAPDMDHRVGETAIAFLRLLEKRDQVAVGDFPSVLVSANGVFQFVSMGTLFFDPDTFVAVEPGRLHVVATGENAEYRLEILAPPHTDWMSSAFGYHFPHAKLSYMYRSADRGFPSFWKLYRDLDGDQLSGEMEGELGHRLAHIQVKHAPMTLGISS